MYNRANAKQVLATIMMPRIYAEIEAAIARGVAPQYVSDALISIGYPPSLVNQALDAWLLSHGRLTQKTDI